MNKVLNGLNFTLAYLDDVIIFSETAEKHLKYIQIVLTRPKQANLKLEKSKCAYLDDVIIFSETAEQHLKYIQIVLTRLKQANLKLEKSKCAFFTKELHYLGHLLTIDGIKPKLKR